MQCEDIKAWTDSKIEWSDVERGVLLNGPRGSGMMIYARALANMCGVKLILESAGSWQAAGHLGDMLKSMRRSFKLASELAKYAHMTPVEMMRAQYLEAHRMTEEDLQKVPADQRAAIERTLRIASNGRSNKDSTSAIGDVPYIAGASGGNAAGADEKPA